MRHFTEKEKEFILKGEFTSRRQIWKEVTHRSPEKIQWLNENKICMPVIYSDQDVLRELRGLKTIIGRIPTSKDAGEKLVSRAQRKFGSWNEALFQAFGEVVQNRYNHLTNEDLKNIIISYIRTYQRLPLRSEFDGTKYPDHETITRRLEAKNWTEVLGSLDLQGITYYASRGYGRIREYKGKLFISNQEFLIGKWLIDNGFTFEQEVKYNDSTQFRFDFYVPKLDLYIEYYGLSHIPEYLQNIEKKRLEYNGRDVLEIFKHDNTIKKLSCKVQRLNDSIAANAR